MNPPKSNCGRCTDKEDRRQQLGNCWLASAGTGGAALACGTCTSGAGSNILTCGSCVLATGAAAIGTYFICDIPPVCDEECSNDIKNPECDVPK